ncbi:hypothetical protein PV04_09970 [Phialophora macrospora]|uniref:Xylanolytic transcriptional activator regulatory domain-containing protein n=1 Tax=Phialophora macrospora TaxID=1851006 RepID=A0A0D2F5D7_9EURO|nr:hypothetical protein PV04_09970 [Phialophora macrospora]
MPEKEDQPCKGYDPVSDIERPRSVLHHLEEKVALLETRISDLPNQTRPLFPDIVGSSGLTLSLASALVSPVALVDAEAEDAAIYYSSLHLQQSSLPLPLSQRAWHRRRDDLGDVDTYNGTDLSHVPKAAAQFMFDNYIDVHEAQYPCLNEEDLNKSFEICMDRASKASSYDLFTIYMVLAISSNTLIWKNERNAVAASAWFFRRAKDQLLLPATVGTERRQLEVALLLTKYSFVNPTACDPWYCIGDAVRLCIHLGLHEEPSRPSTLNPRELDARRKLFWTTCGLERTICSHLRLPFTLRDSPTMPKFPSALADACITPDGVRTGPPKKAPALHILQFRLLESEIHGVLWTEEPCKFTQLDDWYIDISTRVENWYSGAVEFAACQQPEDGPEQQLEISTLLMNYLKFRLNRPCPKVRHRSRQCRVQCIQSAMEVIEDYTRYYHHRRLFYPWFAGHLLFEMAVVLLDTVWTCSAWLRERIELSKVLECITGLPNLLRQVASFWPAVNSCADCVETLAEPVIRYLAEVIFVESAIDLQDSTPLLSAYLFPESAPASLQNLAADTAAQDVDELDLDAFEQIDWSNVAWSDQILPNEG